MGGTMGWHQLLAAGCTIFSLTLLVLVVTSHQWIAIESPKQMYASGIWKICSKMVCRSIRAKMVYFQIIRILLVLALFSGFFCSSYMLFTYRYSSTARLSRFLFSAIGCFITGFLMVIAVIIYTIFIAQRGIDREVHITYQPAFYLAWCLGPAFTVSGILCLVAHYFMPAHRISVTDQDSLYRSSGSDLRVVSMDSYRRDMMLSSMTVF